MNNDSAEDAAPAYAREDMARAWLEGYNAGHAFGWEYAQDTHDGPGEDPTPNPYEITPEHSHMTGGAWNVTRWAVPGCPACEAVS